MVDGASAKEVELANLVITTAQKVVDAGQANLEGEAYLANVAAKVDELTTVVNAYNKIRAGR
jgi:hypothetical protein